jgi:hypothetical protein
MHAVGCAADHPSGPPDAASARTGSSFQVVGAATAEQASQAAFHCRWGRGVAGKTGQRRKAMHNTLVVRVVATLHGAGGLELEGLRAWVERCRGVGGERWVHRSWQVRRRCVPRQEGTCDSRVWMVTAPRWC